jgi:hypothetical protein
MKHTYNGSYSCRLCCVFLQDGEALLTLWRSHALPELTAWLDSVQPTDAAGGIDPFAKDFHMVCFKAAIVVRNDDMVLQSPVVRTD